jgi:hypothetical protein
MKRAVIDYDRKGRFEGSKGRVIIDGAELGDPRVAEVLDDLAKTGAQNVRLEFEEDFF